MKKKTVTGWLCRCSGIYKEWVDFYGEPRFLSDVWCESSETWKLSHFREMYTCKGFKLNPGDSVFVEIEL